MSIAKYGVLWYWHTAPIPSLRRPTNGQQGLQGGLLASAAHQESREEAVDIPRFT